MPKKLICLIMTICLLSAVFSVNLTANAERINKGKITISTVAGVTGDSVIVSFDISENPGIMSMTISITYNSEALEYEKYYSGDVLTDYYFANNPNKNLIRFVNSEYRNRTKNGTLFSLQFRIKNNAEADFHKVNIEYSYGDFCNWNLDRIMPEIVSGGIDVAFNGNNCRHKSYDEWSVAAEPSCSEKGAEQRICKTCGHVDLRDTEPIGHEYSDNWTVDRPATPETSGTMSRYCIRCNDYVDRMSFTYENTENGDIDNNIGADVPINDYTEGIFKEQYPNQNLTENKPASNNNTHQSGDKNIDPPDNTSTRDEASAYDSVINKITEVFPNYEKILNIFKAALFILFILIFR